MKEQLTEHIVSIYQLIEDDVLRYVGRRLQVTLAPDDIAEWKLGRLEELGPLRKDILKTLAKYSGRAEKEVAEALKTYGLATVEVDEEFYKKHLGAGPVPLDASDTVKDILDAAVRHSRGTLNLVHTTALESALIDYLQILNQVHLEVLTGISTYTEAVRKASQRFAKKGVTGLTYVSDAGRETHVSIEAAVRRSVITGMSQVAGDLQIDRMHAWGVNLVEVSSHMGARPSHAEWQGKVYALSGRTEKYANLAEATGYGTGPGLLGWNCRHFFYPYLEGISEPQARQFEADANDRVYEQTQEQRRMERLIRADKRQLLMAKATGNTDLIPQLTGRIGERMAELKAYAESIDQYFQPERLEVFTG